MSHTIVDIWPTQHAQGDKSTQLQLKTSRFESLMHTKKGSHIWDPHFRMAEEEGFAPCFARLTARAHSLRPKRYGQPAGLSASRALTSRFESLVHKKKGSHVWDPHFRMAEEEGFEPS